MCVLSNHGPSFAPQLISSCEFQGQMLAPVSTRLSACITWKRHLFRFVVLQIINLLSNWFGSRGSSLVQCIANRMGEESSLLTQPPWQAERRHSQENRILHTMAHNIKTEASVYVVKICQVWKCKWRSDGTKKKKKQEEKISRRSVSWLTCLSAYLIGLNCPWMLAPLWLVECPIYT